MKPMHAGVLCAAVFTLFLTVEAEVNKYRKDNNKKIPNELYKKDSEKILVKSKQSNPFLYYNKEDVSKMIQQASSTHNQIADVITTAGNSLKSNPSYYLPPIRQDIFDSKWNEIYGNNLCAFAMYCVLNPRDQQTISLVKTYMDRMANYTDWYVAVSRNVDEVPVAHSLTGFATAYDFLFNFLEPSRRKLYLNKIILESRNLYKIVLKKHAGWTRQYIHNHAPTNLLALMLGAMISHNHNVEEAEAWIEIARQHFDRAMILLANVIDGSLDEGVAYGSYTSRGITQYIYLANRHFNVDHTKNPWLKEHFWFYYATVLPGFQRTVGIADSNYNWFYGPESQLVFLDNYVMRNGYGNWLADHIRNSKPSTKPLARSSSQMWSTVHTEFIFYNSSIGSKPPTRPLNSSLHVFSDWGVATYGGGQAHGRGNTFLSFKSGSLNGEAVKDIIENTLYADWVEGWKSFNAGHEHPDQNSFVFAPNGRYFITEGLYSTKFTDLNNVLLFAPFDGSLCNQPWQGQTGECFKWLKYNTNPIPRGEILTAAENDGMVFMAGESSEAYPKELNLRSVFRALTLINPEVLVMIDYVELYPGSKVNRVSAMFHNKLHRFEKDKHLGYNGAKIEFPEGSYKMFWFSSDGQSPISIIKKAQMSDGTGSDTNNVNVTYKIAGDRNLMAYIFLGPSYDVQAAWFHESSHFRSILSIIINGVEYKLRLGLDTKMRDVKHTTADLRKETTRYGGYATVEVENQEYYFGVGALLNENVPFETDATKLKYSSETKLFKEKAHQIIELRKVMSDYGDKRGDDFVQYKITSSNNETTNFYSTIVMLAIVGLIAMILILLIRRGMLRRFQITNLDAQRTKAVCDPTHQIFNRVAAGISMSRFSLPLVVASQLPQSGGEILEYMFDNLTDFMYIPVGKRGINVPVKDRDSNLPDIMHWVETTDIVATGWFSSLHQFTKVFFNNQPISNRVRTIKKILRQNLNSVRVLNLLSGFWNSKLSWIQQILEGKNTRYIIVVKDPRTWIEELKCSAKDSTRETLNAVLNAYISVNKNKLLPQEQVPEEYESFFKDYKLRDLTTNEILSAFWTINTLSSLRELYENIELERIQILRMEDVTNHPEKTYRSIFARLGMPVSTAKLNRLIRFTKSKEIEDSDKILSEARQRTCLKLSDLEITEITDIAGSVMELLNYDIKEY